MELVIKYRSISSSKKKKPNIECAKKNDEADLLPDVKRRSNCGAANLKRQWNEKINETP
jgi:hypothetical protein